MDTTRRSLQPSMFLVVPAALALGWAGTVAATDVNQKFPATGQTKCYSFVTEIACPGTGHDGDIQAGATLKYKDNGNGTITDRNTRLVWEKKSDDGSIHHPGNLYTWDDAFAVHIAALNNSCANNENMSCTTNAECAGVGGKCGFAGKRDWRVPNVKELQSIVNYQNVNPAVSPAFDTNCTGSTVTSGSCTVASGYWSSTTFANFPGVAWGVGFRFGDVSAGSKSLTFHVRAVRGGAP